MKRAVLARASATAAVVALTTLGAGLVPAASAAATATAATIAAANSGATIGGIAGHPATGNGSDCPSGYLCIYTGTNYTGTVFKLYYCQTYSMYGWTGTGSFYNHQTTNTAARFYRQDHSLEMLDYAPDKRNWDFLPDWYVKPC